MNDFPCCDPEPCGVPDVDYGPVWVEPIETPTKPPYGSDARAEYDRKEAAFPPPRCGHTWLANGDRHTCLFRHNEGYHLCDCGMKAPASVDLDAIRYAATYGQAGEDEAPLFLAAADEIERLREQLDIANWQIRSLCAEADSLVADIRVNEAEVLLRGLWARADELVAERNAMAAHVNQLAEDWQNERERADRLEKQLNESHATIRGFLGPTLTAKRTT